MEIQTGYKGLTTLTPGLHRQRRNFTNTLLMADAEVCELTPRGLKAGPTAEAF